MELTSILNKRKSVRTYTGELISQESLKKILNAANAAPVGRAKYETVHLTVVTNKSLLGELEENTARVFETENHSFLYGAPQLVIVSTTATDNVGYSNAAIIAHNMALAAVDENVGVCHIWGAVMALSLNKELVAKLGIPDGFSPACAVAIGKTNEAYTEREIPENRISVNFA